MSAPNTPTRRRVISPEVPVDSPARANTPSRRGTPLKQTATASPQGILQCYTGAWPRSAETPDASSTAAPDAPPSTPLKTTPQNAGPAGALPPEEAGTPAEEETQDGWKMTGESALVERAKRTGLLNLASRGLDFVPQLVYSALLHHSSPFHPSKRSSRLSNPQSEFDFTVKGENEATSVPWYEQEVLRSLNLSNNELASLDEEVGGFEDLESLDLHNNHLLAVPSSLAFLHNLTSISLSHNRLTTFPLQLLALNSLKELSLAHNELRELWPGDWPEQLRETVEPPTVSPSATPERAERVVDLFARTTRPSGDDNGETSVAPWPRLKRLDLGGNPLGPALRAPGLSFPEHLASLDLSGSSLQDEDVPLEVLGALPDLGELVLSRNELSDAFGSDVANTPTRTLFTRLEKLHLALNPIESLEHIEAFLTARVGRPIDYFGLPQIVANLVGNLERRDGRRTGVPTIRATPEEPSAVDAAESAAEAPALAYTVDVRECPLTEEQPRRRALFPPTASSLARERAQRLQLRRAPPAQAAPRDGPGNQVEMADEPSTPETPGSPTSSMFDPAVRAHEGDEGVARTETVEAPATPTRRAPVVLEAWEVEAAAGLSTPAGRRKAAAKAAREAAAAAEEAQKRLREEELAAARRAEQQRREEELIASMEKINLDEKKEDEEIPDDEETISTDGSLGPPPYSPRTPSFQGEPTASVRAEPTTSAREREVEETDARDELDEALVVLLAAASRTAVNLSGRALAAIPCPTRPQQAAQRLGSVTQVDLSRNQLTAIPFRGLTTWGCAASLRVLDLSQNRLAAGDFVAKSLAEGVSFPALEALDLSQNALTSSLPTQDGSGAPVPLLAALASVAPSLGELRLRRNRLTDLSGIAELVRPTDGCDRPERKRRLRLLDLGENRISNLDDLCAVAEQEASIAPPASLSLASPSPPSSSWRCDELDLSMNEIRQLPPKLGYLPSTLVLHLVGNAFRFPKREVYEFAGERRVIPWLRERL
ncbi:hypothetical protein JCM8202v2_005163 [Rhodotorula sphaerocarpa]